ncbi:MAG: hypothetical protein VB092_05620 [Oscillospiraceae bacterium]|nr:hypothetical protein [Oscillospiraceae bacterium]
MRRLIDERLQELHGNVAEYAPPTAPAKRGTKASALKAIAAAAAVGAVVLFFGGVELRCTQQRVGATSAEIDVHVTSLKNSALSGVTVDYRLEGDDGSRALTLPAQTLSFTGLSPATTYTILFTVDEGSSVSTVSYPFTTAAAGATPYIPSLPAAQTATAPPQESVEDPPAPEILEPEPTPKPTPAPAVVYTAPTVSVMWYEGNGGGGSLGWTITPNDGENISCTMQGAGAGYTPAPVAYDTAALDAGYSDGAGHYTPVYNFADGTFTDGTQYNFTLTVSYTLNGAAGSVTGTGSILPGFAGAATVACSAPDASTCSAVVTVSLVPAASAGNVTLQYVSAEDTVNGDLAPREAALSISGDSTASCSFTFDRPVSLNQLSVQLELRWTSDDGSFTEEYVTYLGNYNLS